MKFEQHISNSDSNEPILPSSSTLEKTRKHDFRVDFGALRRDWFAKKEVNLEGKKYSELKEEIQKFYEENAEIIKGVLETEGDSVENELSQISKRHLNREKINQIRKKINLPKYTSLAETVAFIKTAIDTSDDTIQERYAEYCALGISLDDMRNVLTYENDVKPVRLDTDIHHQSPHRTRSVVEIASNAIDANAERENTIGRFGVGFYQILSHLNSGEDVVTVKTGTKDDGFFEINFKLIDGEIKFDLTAVESGDESGTTVTLKSKDFPADEAEKMINKHLSYNAFAEVFCNGKLVNNLSNLSVEDIKRPTIEVTINEEGYIVKDNGKGMTPQIILEKLLVPKISGKKPFDEILNENKLDTGWLFENRIEGDNEPGRAVINVGGVVIEEFETSQFNTVKTFVIDLPPSTFLSEERNKIAVDKTTISSIKKITAEICSSGRIDTLNALYHAVECLQRRSLSHLKEDNMLNHLRKIANESLPEDKIYVPNGQGFERLKIENTVLLNPGIKSTSWTKIEGIKNVESLGEGISLYVAPLEEKIDEPIVIYKNRIIISEDVYEKYKKDPTVLNHYLDAVAKSESVKIKEVQAVKIENTSNVEAMESYKYLSLEDYLSRNYKMFGFLNEGAAIDFIKTRDHEKFNKVSELIVELIINKYPEAYSRFFVTRIINGYDSNENGNIRLVANLDEENLKKFTQLSNDPELIDLFLELDILPMDIKEKINPAFKGLIESYSEVIINDSEYTGQKAFRMSYYDKNNLVFEDGQRFVTNLMSSDYIRYFGCTKEFLLGPTDDFSEIRFVNAVTREIREIDFNVSEDALENIKNVGLTNPIYKKIDDRDLLLVNYNYPLSGKKGKEYAYFIDIHTGELYNPRPDLGEIIKVRQQPVDQSSADTKEIRKAQKIAQEVGAFTVFYGSHEDNGVQDITYVAVGDNQHKGLTSYDLSNYYHKDGNLGWFVQNIIKDNYYSKENKYNHEYEEGGVYKLLFDGKTVIEIDSASVFENAKNKGFPKTQYWESDLDTYINLQNVFIDSEEYSIIQLRAGKTFLFDSNGSLIKEFDNDHVLCGIQKTKDGKTVLITAKRTEEGYKREPSGLFVDSNMVFFSHNPDLKSIRINDDYFSDIEILDISGNKIEIDDLENPESILLSKSHGNQLWSRAENSLYSFKKGKWDYSFSVNSCKILTTHIPRTGSQSVVPAYSYDKPVKMELVRLVNPNTKELLLPNVFRSVRYIANKNIWECIEADDKIEDNVAIESKIYINESGEIVDEIKIGKQTGMYDNKKTLNNYDSPGSDRSIIKIEREFTQQQQDSIKKALSEKVFEGRSDTPSLMSRLYKYNYLSEENFDNIIEILISIEHLDDRLLSDEMISDVMTQLKDHDSQSKIWFYKIASNLTPPGDVSQVKEFTNRLLSLYKNKISHLSTEKKQEVYDSFTTARDYNGEYLVNGWNIVKHKTPVSLSQIPENIRAIVDYLTVDDMEVLGDTKEPIIMKTAETFTLSELIQTKRLNETKVRGVRETEELKEMIREKTSGKNQDHIRREIIHPIYYQTVDNNYLFIRELIQNAHDAVIESNEEVKDNSVKVDVYSKQEKEVTLRIEDSVGMDFHTLVNYFLIPGETTKLDSEKAIGYFGQGLFTLFRGAEEVVLQTSLGDGRISKLKITPLVNENGMISDLNVHFESEEGKMKGTVIERTVKTDSPVIEAAYIKNATSTFASLVDGDVIKINLNDRQINGSLNKLGSVDVEGLGTMIMYDAPNNAVTQRGLFIKTVDADYDTGMSDVESLLKKKGYVLNIPENIDLTRSRNEIARKEEVLEQLKGKVANVKMRSYLEIFRQDIQKGNAIQLDNLPYDYFYFPMEFNSSKLDLDVKKIVNGESLDNVEDYYDRGSLVSLLVRLPAVAIDDKMYSIYELKWAALERKSPLDNEEKFRQIPKGLRDKLLEGKKEYDRLESRRSEEKSKEVADFDFDDWKKQPTWVQEQIAKQLEEYTGMISIVEDLNNQVSSTIEGQPKVGTTLYYEPNSRAHATQGFGKIGWNLQSWQGWNINKFKEKDLKDKDISDFLYVWSHEWGHILEKSGSFTHNKSFYKKQAEALSRLMQSEK